MNFVTDGHFEASSLASAVVIRRQLLSPNPSASAKVICLLPHQAGFPPVLLLVPLPELALALVLELELLLEPHALTTAIAATAAQTVKRTLRSTFFNIRHSLSLLWLVSGFSALHVSQRSDQAAPGHAVDRDAGAERGCLDKVLGCVLGPRGQDELIKLA